MKDRNSYYIWELLNVGNYSLMENTWILILGVNEVLKPLWHILLFTALKNLKKNLLKVFKAAQFVS